MRAQTAENLKRLAEDDYFFQIIEGIGAQMAFEFSFLSGCSNLENNRPKFLE